MNPSPIRLLLVEDSPPDALLLKHALAEAGAASFRVTHVEQMADAERCLAGDDFDAILLDLSLPDSRGVDTVKRANAVAPRLPIVVMTGLDDEAMALEAVRTGAQDFLVKGSGDGRLLARAIRYAMERKQAEQELKALNETLEQRVAERTATATRRAAQLQALASELTLTEQRERRRLAEILHDQLQQLIYAARLNLGALQPRVRDAGSQELLRKIDELLAQAMDQSRSLTVELSPPVLYDAGLAAALEWLGRYMEQTCGLSVEVQADPQAEPDGEDLHILLFQSVRELLFNVVKHGRTGRARVKMAAAPRAKVRLEVSDDGAGFDPASLKVDHSVGGGFGLFSIRERLELLGGQLEVEASPGHGSRMTIFVPRRRSNAGAGPSRKGERRLPRPAATSLQEPTT